MSSDSQSLVRSSDPLHSANLIPVLCRQFYQLGWVTGTGDLVYIAPSGVQKERIESEDLFVMDKKTMNLIHSPVSNHKPSACTPLFFNAFTLRNAGACIHSHSQNAVLATMLFDKEFEISNQEMIKGIKKDGSYLPMMYSDRLVVPIIDNTLFEQDLTSFMADAMNSYPETSAVLVKNHGVYVWGKTWQDAKTMAECYDYLFELAIKIKAHGLKV
ncbi:hypothetical protein BB560_002732 [Smittium megazygosporum]|uniref:Methylthioribulose-1-phosphate dehydratase n=1 Tax=Smittium megazygosporum TaxID=133381 RepID=A0A2T9ZDW5_9FUNG|nr:hypothetical protein BB560_002732 [Smittium megazygosporum]